MVRALVLDQIRSLGYTAVEAEDGPSALARLAEMGQIDLLFTDLVMPGGLNGKELAEKVRQARPGIRVLLTSGYRPEAGMREGGIDTQFQLLAKPYRKADLGRALRQCLTADRADCRADRQQTIGPI
jgi:CheY-like chemotaxis protein